jgi:hypothetical protein
MGYRGKVEEQNRARDLRAQGWTLGEICDELGVSKASASLWCRDVEIDQAELQRRRTVRGLAARQRPPNRLQRAKQEEIERLRLEGRRRIGVLTEREFLVAGLALYAGEGAKRDGFVLFANSDPRMILFFVTWLRHFFPVDESRLRMRLYLHQGLDLEGAVKFWSVLTRIPPSQFGKPYRAVPDASIRRAKHPLGCPAVALSSTTVHRSLMGQIEALLSSSLPVGQAGLVSPG